MYRALPDRTLFIEALIQRSSMNVQGATWSTWREAVSVVVAPKNLRRTVSIALIIGSVFFAMNQLGTIVAGQATALVWLKAAMTYLTPLVVSNFGVLSATRRYAAPLTAAPNRR
jgi:hypothetical protein